jgi:plastocyanin
MMWWRIPSIGIAAALALVFTGSAVAQEAPKASVDISQYLFKPKELTVTAGTTVTWTNNDAEAHTVTADDLAWDSDLFGSGDQFSMTFDTPGTFGYFCIPHGSPGMGMFGTIVVVADQPTDVGQMEPAPEPTGDEEEQMEAPPPAPADEAPP